MKYLCDSGVTHPLKYLRDSGVIPCEILMRLRGDSPVKILTGLRSDSPVKILRRIRGKNPTGFWKFRLISGECILSRIVFSFTRVNKKRGMTDYMGIPNMTFGTEVRWFLNCSSQCVLYSLTNCGLEKTTEFLFLW